MKKIKIVLIMCFLYMLIMYTIDMVVSTSQYQREIIVKHVVPKGYEGEIIFRSLSEIESNKLVGDTLTINYDQTAVANYNIDIEDDYIISEEIVLEKGHPDNRFDSHYFDLQGTRFDGEECIRVVRKKNGLGVENPTTGQNTFVVDEDGASQDQLELENEKDTISLTFISGISKNNKLKTTQIGFTTVKNRLIWIR